MAVRTVTAPVFLDSTANNMITALDGIRDAVQPVNIYVDIDIEIPIDGWSDTNPHRYTWTNARVTNECGIEVSFREGAEDIAMDYIEYEKVIGGVRFSIDTIPDASIPCTVRIINASADTIINPVDDTAVSTDAVANVGNVHEALVNVDGRITENANDISTLQTDLAATNTEVAKRVKTVNGIAPDATGDVSYTEVEFARQLVTDDAQQSTDEYLFRTTGGDASLTDGDAKLVTILGRSTHTGVVAESLEMTITMATRELSEDDLTATIDRDTFVAYVDASGTTTLTYTTEWSADPTLYGVTVGGTAKYGDVITIMYVKADRGTITNSNPSSFVSTGWNLYNHEQGYARVRKYSTTMGYLIGGTYTGVQFSATLSGSKSTIEPVSGYFTIPSDGYVWVTGGSNEDTYILMTWSDWTEGYDGDFETYTESVVDLTTIMEDFPNGLMQVGAHADEINFSMARAISRIERMAYTDENLATVVASGREYDADENYIYVVKATEQVYTIAETGLYTACDHGNEIIDGGTVAVYVQTLYGHNLVDKLRTDVLTISDMSLSSNQQKSARNNIGAIGSVNGLTPDASGAITLPTDNSPTQNSNNYVKSGGVYTELAAINQRIGNVESPASVFQDFNFSIPVASWTGEGPYTALVTSAVITSTSGIWVFYDSSYNTYASAPISSYVTSGGGSATFTTDTKPTSAISGYIRVVDSVNGIIPIERGGTAGNSLATAQQNLGITALNNAIARHGLNFDSISAETVDDFITAIATRINSIYTLSSCSNGASFFGYAEWSGVSLFSFQATKVSSKLNVIVTNGATRNYLGYVVISTLTIGEYDSIATSSNISQLDNNITNYYGNHVKSVTKEITISSDQNHLVALGISLPNIVINVNIVGNLTGGYTTYQNKWLCTICDYNGNKITSGTFTVTIYYLSP